MDAQFAKPDSEEAYPSEESLAARIVELLEAVYVGSARWMSYAGYELNVRLAQEVVRREPTTRLPSNHPLPDNLYPSQLDFTVRAERNRRDLFSRSNYAPIRGEKKRAAVYKVCIRRRMRHGVSTANEYIDLRARARARESRSLSVDGPRRLRLSFVI